MRTAALALVLVSPTVRGADDTPTADEQKAIAAVTKLGGKAKIDPDLAPEARVAATFDALNDLHLAKLKAVPQLGALTTGDARKCTDRGLGSLKDLPHLQRLIVSSSAASTGTVAAIAECTQLRVLYLGEAKITDAGLVPLKKLTRLEDLDLNGNLAISDRGMAYLKDVPRLEKLNLGRTQLTDRGLEPLKELEGLTRLNVTGTKVTAAAAEKFEQVMPNLRAVRQ